MCFHTGTVNELGEKNTRVIKVLHALIQSLIEQYDIDRQNYFSMAMIFILSPHMLLYQLYSHYFFYCHINYPILSTSILFVWFWKVETITLLS